MNGKIVWQSDAVIDAFACQEYLQLLGPVYGAEVFFFSDLEGVCWTALTGAVPPCQDLQLPLWWNVKRTQQQQLQK